MKLGIRRGTVKLGYGHDEWKIEFEHERAYLSSVFGNHAIHIEHIGSTSIPGLIAKPLLDIAILVYDLNKIDKSVQCLIDAGYKERVGRLSGKQLVFAKGSDRNVTHHLHIIENGETDWKDKIEFKQLLLDNSQVKEAYATLKRKLSKQNQENRAKYSAAKGTFIKEALASFRQD